jgi:hypothetical protein
MSGHGLQVQWKIFTVKKLTDFTAEDVINIVGKWKESVLEIDRLLYEDAKKEFSMSKMTGFGVDGRNGARELDFTQVRGEFEKNETVKAIQVHMQTKEALGNDLISRLTEKRDDAQASHHKKRARHEKSEVNDGIGSFSGKIIYYQKFRKLCAVL